MRRFSRLFALQLLLLVILLASCDLASSTRSRGRKKPKSAGLCHIKDQTAPMNCNCFYHRNVTEIDCWVVKPLAREDPFWSHFASQTHLEKLLLKQHENGILDYVPTHLLHQLKNVRAFELLYVQMLELAEHSFANLTDLSELRVTDSKIRKLREYAFENMRNLVIIDLGRNNISEIGRNTFVELPALRTLYLDRNVIRVVHDKAFKHLTSLQKLVLNHNNISIITRDCFHGLRSLQHLDLRNNNISMIGQYNFAEMPELQVLELDDNNITFIAVHAFDGMYKLRKLYISGNKLARLEPDVLVGASNVHFLDLRRNQLRTMSFDNIKPIVTNLYNQNSSLYLGDNKLSCDCKLTWIWGLRNETKNTHMRTLLEKLTCYLENNNATERVYGVEWENFEENSGDNSKYSEGDEDGSRDEEDRENDDEVELEISLPLTNLDTKTDCEGKVCYKKRLFDLKPEELPCPEREDLMASEQPSSHHEKARVGISGSIWFSSSAKAVRSVLAATLLPLLFALLT